MSQPHQVLFFLLDTVSMGPTLCLAHEIIAMYFVDEITCTFTISGLAGRFEESFTLHSQESSLGVLLLHLSSVVLLLELAVLLVSGEVATSGEALSHKCSPTCGLKQTCPVRDISRLYPSRAVSGGADGQKQTRC